MEPMPQPEFGIDPSLGDFAPAVSYHNYGSFSDGRVPLRRSHEEYIAEAEPVLHPGMQTLAPAESSWSVPNGGNAFDEELNGWHD